MIAPTFEIMFIARLAALALIAFSSVRPVCAQSEAEPTPAETEGEATLPETVALASLPYSFVERFRKSELHANYVVGYAAVNPFYLTGDFDGDGQMDYILRLVSKKDKDKEEDAVFFAKGAARLLSKDITETYPGPAWYVVSKKEKIGPGLDLDEAKGTKPPKLKGDAIMMVTPESSSALIFWNGKRFELSWQGD